ncbi:MAG: RagB/SusD family nutrient uptake outer membrane protein [Draconibacterium sp.]|nr:RagB/SusD family nutrient uptake outer membrane protein [Draconibacterium sp.]
MKFKNIIPIFILLFAFACSTEFLDEVHPTQNTSESFFENDDDAEAATISLYDDLWRNVYGRFFDKWLSYYDMTRGDNLILPKQFYSNDIVKYLTLNYNEETGSVREAWQRCYQVIYKANWIIDNVSENENISEEVKNASLAEAYFMRGYNYFTLVRLFGEVPLVLKQTTSENYYPEQATSEEVWAQVDADLQKALGMLPAPTKNFIDGRVNKGVANAIIARTYLYRTKPGSTQYWDKVQQYAQATEGIGVYGLEPMEDFSKLFVYTTEDKWVKNTEVIWAVGAVYGPIYGGRPFMYDQSSTVGCGAVSPVGYATIVVHNENGVPYLPGNARTGRAQFAVSPELSDIMIDYGKIGDKRTTEFLFYPTFNDYGYQDPDDNTSAYVKSVINADSLYQRLKETNGAEGEYLHIKKYMIRQFLGTNIWDGGYYHPMMMPVIRYADILLMRAEAEFNLGNEGQAKTYLKKITDRAGFAADYVNQFSGEALHNEILQQRRVELMFETQRVPDLMRLDLFKPPHVGTYPGSVTWDEKLKVLPIPQRELDYNKNLIQNPLWR